jgi:hypothetical protein
MGDDRGLADILCGLRARHQDAHAVDRAALHPIEQDPEEGALLLAEGLLAVVGHDREARPLLEQPGDRAGVGRGGLREGQAPGLLVDSEGEEGRLHGRDRRRAGAARHEARDQQRRGRSHPLHHVDVAPNGFLGRGVMVVDVDLHPGFGHDLAKLAETGRHLHVDQDDARERHAVDLASLLDREVLAVGGEKLAHAGVRRPVEKGDRARIEMTRGDHRGEAVEVGADVGEDDFGRAPAHAARVRPPPSPRCRPEGRPPSAEA